MEDEKYQKELFEFEKPKRLFPRFGRIFTRANFAVTLTMEKIVFISIGLIMLMVIIYALGVERGKTFSKSITAVISKPPVAKIAPSLPATQTQLVQDVSKPYTIAAVTLTRKETAVTEANRLKKEGLDSFVVESGPYFLVCVGAYPDKDSVQSKKALSGVKRFYKDAYFKLR